MAYNIYDYLTQDLYTKGVELAKEGQVSMTVPGNLSVADEVRSESIISGEVDGNLSFIGGFIQSKNYVSGSTGWQLTPTSGQINFAITIGAGSIIGGFEVGADYIRDVANSMGMASTVTGGDDVRFWAGDTYANRATADFRVTEAGAVT